MLLSLSHIASKKNYHVLYSSVSLWVLPTIGLGNTSTKLTRKISSQLVVTRTLSSLYLIYSSSSLPLHHVNWRPIWISSWRSHCLTAPRNSFMHLTCTKFPPLFSVKNIILLKSLPQTHWSWACCLRFRRRAQVSDWFSTFGQPYIPVKHYLGVSSSSTSMWFCDIERRLIEMFHFLYRVQKYHFRIQSSTSSPLPQMPLV